MSSPWYQVQYKTNCARDNLSLTYNLDHFLIELICKLIVLQNPKFKMYGSPLNNCRFTD